MIYIQKGNRSIISTLQAIVIYEYPNPTTSSFPNEDAFTFTIEKEKSENKRMA